MSSYKLYFIIGPQIVLVSNDTSLIAGETGFLVCVSYGPSSEETAWTVNGIPVNSSRITTFEETVTQAGLIFKQSFLQFCSVEVEESGAYSCTVTNDQTSVSSTIQLSVSG